MPPSDSPNLTSHPSAPFLHSPALAFSSAPLTWPDLSPLRPPPLPLTGVGLLVDAPNLTSPLTPLLYSPALAFSSTPLTWPHPSPPLPCHSPATAFSSTPQSVIFFARLTSSAKRSSAIGPSSCSDSCFLSRSRRRSLFSTTSTSSAAPHSTSRGWWGEDGRWGARKGDEGRGRRMRGEEGGWGRAMTDDDGWWRTRKED